ncbi:MAG: hypothetical protein KBF63_05125 [Rhodoferax sp.]|nr:hypothetical protein [Rhodoferax sp.]MBP9928638.1 hypothetical protein [Rhodoferax sp.]HQX59972.1 hypothetical protein [Burkholderiaceae bacterium]
MIELSFWKLINHHWRTASPPAMRMLLEKKPVSKGKLMFFTLACCFCVCRQKAVFPLTAALLSALHRVPGIWQVAVRACDRSAGARCSIAGGFKRSRRLQR